MSKLLRTYLALVVALIGGFLLFGSSLRANDPIALACPNGQTVLLTGQAERGIALLIYLRGRAVGGGLADQTGAFSLPLRPQERPGIYPVEVRTRNERALVASYSCYIDVELAPTTVGPTVEGETPLATSSGGRPTITATAPPNTPRPNSTAIQPSTPSPQRSATPGPSTTSATATAGPSSTPIVAPSASPTTSTSASPTATATKVPSDMFDISINLDNDLNQEFVQIYYVDDQTINMAGWRLRNASRSGVVPDFTFPSYNLAGDASGNSFVMIYSGVGEDERDQGIFYWDRSSPVWLDGNIAELYDDNERLIATATATVE